MVNEYYDVPASPYPTSGDITIQGEVQPIQKHIGNGETKIGDYMIYPRSLVFTYTGGTQVMSGSRRVGNKQVRVGAATNVFSSFRGMSSGKFERDQSIRFVGVAFEGIANGKDAKNFPVECGRLAVLVSGATTIYCASKEVKDAKFGDILCWKYEGDTEGRVQHGDDDFRFVKLYTIKNHKVGQMTFKGALNAETGGTKGEQTAENDETVDTEEEPTVENDETVDTEEETTDTEGMDEMMERFSKARQDYREREAAAQGQGPPDGGSKSSMNPFINLSKSRTSGKVAWSVWIQNENGRTYNPLCYFPANLSGSDLDETNTQSFFSRVNNTIKKNTVESLIPEHADIYVSSPSKADIQTIGKTFPNILDSHSLKTFEGFNFAHDDAADQEIYQIPFKRSDAINPLSTKNKIQSFLNKNATSLEDPTSVSFHADLDVIKDNMKQFRHHYDNSRNTSTIEERYGVTSSKLKTLSPEEITFLNGTLSKNANYNNIEHTSHRDAVVMDHPLLASELFSKTRDQIKTRLAHENTMDQLKPTTTQLNTRVSRTPLLNTQTSAGGLASIRSTSKPHNIIGMVLDYDDMSKSLRILLDPTKYLS